MKLRFWAKREHYHREFLDNITKFTRCAGCGHILLMGHVDNKRVRVVNRMEGTEHCEIYAGPCIPEWDMKEIAIDGKIRYYKNGQEVPE